MEQASAIRVELAHRGTRAFLWSAAPLLLWAAVIAASWAWGTALNESGARIGLNAPPLFAFWDLELTPRVLVPALVAAVIIASAPHLARTLPWRGLLAAVAAGAAIWAVSLALTDGWSGLTGPLEGPNEYLPVVPLVESPGQFLSTFTERIDEYPTHVRSHPPGMVLILWSLAQLGLGGSTAAAVLVLGIAASAPVAVLVAARAVAGEATARAAAPFLVLLPAAVWIATTADALFMGVGAWAVALLVLAIRADGRRSLAFAVAAGVLFGVAAMLSYGLALVGVVAMAVALGRRRLGPPALAAGCAGAFLLAIGAAGFSWIDGFFAIREQYLASIAKTRPYDYFLLANLAAFALAIGPAIALGIARLRDRALSLLVGGAVAAVAVADLTGMSKAEVERIWLPFVPWVALAAAALSRDRRRQRALLAAQASLGLAIQVGVRTVW